MAMKVFTLDRLTQYDGLIKNYIDTADAKSLKTVAISGNTLKFYRVEEPVGETTPAYEITLPSTDISGLLAKLEGATAGDVVVANADGTVKDGGVKLADLALKSEVTAVSDIANANKTALDEIKNADTGLLKTAKDYADEKVKALADGQVATNKADIEKLNGADTEDGSVAKAVKDSADAINAKIGTLADLDTTAKTDLVGAINEVLDSVAIGGTGSKVTVTTDTTTDGYLKTYTIKQGDAEVAKIDIPKDIFAVSGSVVTNPDADHTGTFIKLVLENQEEPIFIDVASLIENYTAKASATQVQLVVDNNTREISATIVAGSIGTTELGANAVTTAKIADGNVTAAKLADDAKALFDAKGSATQSLTDAKAYTDEQLANIVAIEPSEIEALFTV